MVEQPAGQARSRRGVPLAVVVLAAGIALVLPWLLIAAIPRSSFYGRYVCAHCGIEQTSERSRVAGVTYRERATVEDTAISRALAGRQGGECSHEWYLTYRSGRHSSIRGSEIGCGGKGAMLPLLLIDDDFVRELAEMPRPRDVWRAILRASDASPNETDHLLGDWWVGGWDRRPFADWWQDNEARVRELGLDAKPADTEGRRR